MVNGFCGSAGEERAVRGGAAARRGAAVSAAVLLVAAHIGIAAEPGEAVSRPPAPLAARAVTAGAQAGVRLSGLRPSLRLAGGGVRSVVTTPVFTSGAPVAGTAGVEYAFTVTVEGLGSITFAVTSGSLPAGLSLDASSGKISGIPTTPGTATFAITASNPYGSATQKDTITIASAAPAPAAAAPPAVAKRSGAVLAGDLARTGSEAATSLALGGCGALSLLVVGAMMMMITRRQPLGGR
ncbi:hypothetical protein O159_03130 [Leifsonia xyli subsp. cynodontis DSM 46306]|uniref:Uncharacterized protein n=1 Tax=Leifsonia xyli subsp. cynodontis DSM 46306 TaxID=1389489 RepID=U3P460_LEIXC|nr:hypothetical protein O159_03130 [Leifsonia xyli subsp. cynodontis DSM 46306]